MLPRLKQAPKDGTYYKIKAERPNLAQEKHWQNK